MAPFRVKCHLGRVVCEHQGQNCTYELGTLRLDGVRYVTKAAKTLAVTENYCILEPWVKFNKCKEPHDSRSHLHH
eukprot:scaffold1073_cov98-Cylindrotheca_fusiformis.AAC.3